MSNIDNAVNQLIFVLKETEVYKEYEKQLAIVKQHPEVKEKIDELRTRNFQLQNRSDCTFDELEQLDKEYESFTDIPFVSDFMAAELALCRMMQETYLRITEAIQFD